jgi:transcriptional regulator with XRE-family HTH domain
MKNIDTIGVRIRKLREQANMPLRKLAASLDIDQSTLSKIERDERKPNHQMVENIARIFDIDKKELLVTFYSDIICNEIKNESTFFEILKVASAKLENFKVKSKKLK